MMRLKNNIRGFSLIELMAVIAIVGMISAIALPVYISSMPRRRLKAASRDMYAMMQQAKMLAVKENRSIRIQVGADFYYIDKNNNNTPDTDEKIVNLSQYNDVTFGHGKAVNNWKGTAILVTYKYPVTITFAPLGTATNGTANDGTVNDNSESYGAVYLQNKTSPLETFAITAQASGAIKVRWFDGKTWK